MEKIKINKIRCKRCGDIIESKTAHDFKFCKCGAVAVDGGKEYLRRCFINIEDDYEELISDKEICTFYNNPSKGTNTGNIALVVDYEASTLKIIDAFEDGYYVAEGISFLENISNYDVWDYDKIEEKTSIKYSKKQMLVALSYGKNHVTSLPIKGLETNKKIKNDYTCILSIKFK